MRNPEKEIADNKPENPSSYTEYSDNATLFAKNKVGSNLAE